MRFPRKRGATSVMVTIFVPDNTATNGAGLTTLTNASTNLVVGYRRELSAGWVEYKQSAGNLEAQTTIGTYQAPSSSAKCRIKHDTRGKYEIQLHDSATAFGAGDTSQAILIEIYEETTSALKVGPNAVLIPLSAMAVLDGESNMIQVGGTTQTGRDLGASVLVGDKTGFSLATAPPTKEQISTQVWSETVRSLTTFGTLVSDIWAAATRTLTAISDSSGVTTLLSRIASALSISSGKVTVGANDDKTGYSLATGQVDNAGIAAAQAAAEDAAARLDAMTDDSDVFTADALANAPGGGSGSSVPVFGAAQTVVDP